MLRAFVNCAMVLKKWKKVDQVRSEYLRSYLNWLHNWQLKSRRRSHALKGSHSMGDGRIFLKTGCDASLKKDLSNEPNFDRTGPDSTFKSSVRLAVPMKDKHRRLCNNFFLFLWLYWLASLRRLIVINSQRLTKSPRSKALLILSQLRVRLLWSLCDSSYIESAQLYQCYGSGGSVSCWPPGSVFP